MKTGKSNSERVSVGSSGLVRPSDVFLVTKLMHVPDDMETGKLARAMRKSARLSLREVARRMKVSAAYVSDLELGRRGWTDERVDKYRTAICGPNAERTDRATEES